MEWVSTVLDQVVQKMERQLCSLRISLVDQFDNRNCGFSGRRALSGIDIVTNLQVELQVGLGQRGATCTV